MTDIADLEAYGTTFRLLPGGERVEVVVSHDHKDYDGTVVVRLIPEGDQWHLDPGRDHWPLRVVDPHDLREEGDLS